VNPQSKSQAVDVTLAGIKSVKSDGTQIQLAGTTLKDMNTITEPMKVVPKTVTVTGLSPKFNMIFPAYSVTVLKIETK
jgi:alpha-L-arabinofuranosidase